MTVYNLGSLNIDYVYSVSEFVRPGETICARERNVFPGGKGLNQSVALAKAGAKVIHGGLIGFEGDFLLDTLKKAGVDVSGILKVPESTGHAVIQVEDSGQNSIILFSGANHKIDRKYIDVFLAEAVKDDILLLQNEISGLDHAFAAAKSKGMKIAFNPSPFKENIKSLPLKDVDLWLCNEIEGSELSGETEPEKKIDGIISKYGESDVLLTLGKDGSVLSSRGKRYYQDIFPVETVDTTAAGDTFTGYFISCISSGCKEEDGLKIAAAASAIAVSQKGASISIPEMKEVKKLLETGNVF